MNRWMWLTRWIIRNKADNRTTNILIIRLKLSTKITVLNGLGLTAISSALVGVISSQKKNLIQKINSKFRKSQSWEKFAMTSDFVWLESVTKYNYQGSQFEIKRPQTRKLLGWKQTKAAKLKECRLINEKLRKSGHAKTG